MNSIFFKIVKVGKNKYRRQWNDDVVCELFMCVFALFFLGFNTFLMFRSYRKSHFESQNVISEKYETKKQLDSTDIQREIQKFN